jgi:hypothetical protein
VSGALQAFVLDHVDAFDERAEFVVDGSSRRLVILGRVAGVLEPDTLEVRLHPAVAAAALRTPDVAPSARGAGWVRFSPAEIDGFTRDRALAWVESALRLAAEGDAPG